MNKIITAISAAAILLTGLSGAITPVQAATFSSTKIEILYGQNYVRGFNGADTDEAIFTIANASGFTWGDSFFFAEVTGVNDSEDTGGTHMEFSTRYRFWKPENTGVIKGFYGIVQADITSNAFVEKIVPMGGLSLDWNVPGFKFLKTHVQYRDDPTKDGTSVQFNLVWNTAFTLGGENFTFEGFADWTSGEGDGNEVNLLVQPQLLWLINKNIGVGIEYQYWKNRLGIDGLDESVPQIMVRWTF
ncbi:MAG: hypothetical protein V5789_03965 [Colwellia sp.]